MKKRTVFIILGGIALLITVVAVILTRVYPLSVSPNYNPATVGQASATINDFSAVDLSGNEITNDIFSDSTLTMINVWTTSCSPCLKEMPDLTALDKELEDKGFNVIGIVDDIIAADTGEVSQAALELTLRICEQTGVEYTTLIPDASLKNGILNGLAGYPTTFFIDKDGNIIGKRYFGAQTKDEWKEVVLGLLEELEAPTK
ncbi:MAG: TlpA family protein disulfide reductase [Clostridiales bacterium]|jgi:thiol-disulfide isomerase/thioredoxin|nr:TlpA family protein disulfide reductase [Clostridiales bacterium]